MNVLAVVVEVVSSGLKSLTCMQYLSAGIIINSLNTTASNGCRWKPQKEQTGLCGTQLHQQDNLHICYLCTFTIQSNDRSRNIVPRKAWCSRKEYSKPRQRPALQAFPVLSWWYTLIGSFHSEAENTWLLLVIQLLPSPPNLSTMLLNGAICVGGLYKLD